MFTHLYNRNIKLREQLQSLKKKETEETKALEDMVAKVEKNLVASTVSQHSHCVCTCVYHSIGSLYMYVRIEQ